ncbi:MAG: hypothetical protein II290_02780 [Oscillospiraceae bacterium]|nr:hypothetical protein [Oscillospiraceae bacterium]
MELTWANANPSENEKIRTHYAKIVVECTTGKPYYSIEWFDTAKQEYYLGYSSYCIDNVLGWLKESFEIVEAPKTNADHFRAMSDEEQQKCVRRFWEIEDFADWLKQPAEDDHG